MVTTFPADVVQDLQDFILWQPDATEIGVEAIYVMAVSYTHLDVYKRQVLLCNLMTC
ncbi:hypothetical protein AZZ99_004920 [Serratia marcescens]|nr:hypothetical protein AZZ99_004917 [Serratia marcescens]OUI56166.1 hypothetical protein AZZ99_004920 [Serratia marcescens]